MMVPASAGRIPFALPIAPASQSIPMATPVPLAPTVPSASTARIQVAAGPLPPHLAAGGAIVAAPHVSPPELDVREGDRNDEAVKARFTKTSGGLGFLLTVLGSVLVLVIVIAMVAVYFSNPDLLTFQRQRPAADVPPSKQVATKIEGESEIMWTDASAKSVLRNEIRVRISRVEFGAVMAKDAANSVHKSDSANFLQIFVSLENTGDHDVNYKSWYGNEFNVDGGSVAATLEDDTGHTYPMMTVGDASKIAGHVPAATLGAKNAGDTVRTVKGVIIYEIPETINRGSHKFYRLQLPAAAIGGTGILRFQIPAGMVTDS